MKTTDGEKFQNQTIREPNLCCLVNPRWRCRYCKTVVCYECDTIVYEQLVQQNPGVNHPSVAYTLHKDTACLALNDDYISEAWEDVDVS